MCWCSGFWRNCSEFHVYLQTLTKVLGVELSIKLPRVAAQRFACASTDFDLRASIKKRVKRLELFDGFIPVACEMQRVTLFETNVSNCEVKLTFEIDYL
jgi:hypothetical protein